MKRKISDATKKLIDSSNELKKKIDDALEQHPDLVAGKKASVAYDLAKHKSEINATKNYKPLRDLVVSILEKSSQPKAKKYLAKIEYEFDKKVARDPRENSYNEQFWFNQLLAFIYNIILKADNLGSPDVKDDVNILKSLQKRHYQQMHDSCVIDEKKFKDAEEGYAEKVFIDFVKAFKQTLPNWTLYPDKWIQKGENSLLKFEVIIYEEDVAVEDMDKEFNDKEVRNVIYQTAEENIKQILPSNVQYEFKSLQTNFKADDASFLRLDNHDIEMDRNFLATSVKNGDKIDMSFLDDRQKVIVINIHDDVEDKNKLFGSITSQLYKRGAHIFDKKSERPNKILYAYEDMQLFELNFNLLLNGISQWSVASERENRKIIDLDAYTIRGTFDSIKDDVDPMLILCRLLGEAHDKAMEALDLAKDLIEEGELPSNFEYELIDLNDELDEFDFMSENNPVDVFKEKFGKKEEFDINDSDYDWDYEEND